MDDGRQHPIAFVENKHPDMAHVDNLLAACRSENHWANRGPLYRRLADAFVNHLNVPPGRTITPCANGGVALQAMAQLHEARAGRKLRWAVSSYSFKNLGRGYFADAIIVDCNAQGRLSLKAVRAIRRADCDGLIVTNPFGLCASFDDLFAFARENDLALLLDNAAGLSTNVPDWPWQAFSLHHTKPYGMGEGGLILTPSDASAELYALIDYGATPDRPEAWLGNGKISDISCAFHLERLAQHGDWAPKYLHQRERITRLARVAGLTPLIDEVTDTPVTSVPLLSPAPIPRDRLDRITRFVVAKYYQPLAPTPQAESIYQHMVNIPAHPDMALLSDAQIRNSLEALLC